MNDRILADTLRGLRIRRDALKRAGKSTKPVDDLIHEAVTHIMLLETTPLQPLPPIILTEVPGRKDKQ